MATTAPAVVVRYNDRGDKGGFANLLMANGDRTFLSLGVSGLSIHNLILWGRLPGRSVYTASADAVSQMVRVLARDVGSLPKLPDNAAMDSFLLTAARALADPSVYKQLPLDEDGFPMTHLTVLTRAAIAESDRDAVVRRLTRAANTP
jgi:hypothetical protein